MMRIERLEKPGKIIDELDRNVDILGPFRRKYEWYFEKKFNLFQLMKAHRPFEDKVFEKASMQ